MRVRSWIRSAVTGQFASTNEADADPGSTVRETYGDAGVRVEIKLAAEAVILSAGWDVTDDGRVEVNWADLDRLKAAVGFEPGQP